MKKYKHITNYDRIQIEALMRAGHSIREIAEQLDKNYSTIWRELQKGKYVHRDTNWIEEERYSLILHKEICDKRQIRTSCLKCKRAFIASHKHGNNLLFQQK